MAQIFTGASFYKKIHPAVTFLWVGAGHFSKSGELLTTGVFGQICGGYTRSVPMVRIFFFLGQKRRLEQTGYIFLGVTETPNGFWATFPHSKKRCFLGGPQSRRSFSLASIATFVAGGCSPRRRPDICEARVLSKKVRSGFQGELETVTQQFNG